MNKRLKIALISLLVLVLVVTGGFLLYASDYYRADNTAIEILSKDDSVRLQDSIAVISPSEPTDTALIFYPGAKVEYTAYLPILKKISETSNITCILVKMPFNMAIFDSSAAEDVMKAFPEFKQWFVGGHSMGGAMASSFASKNPDKVDGLILLGAYLYGNYPEENSITIYGSFNTTVAEKIDYTENIIVIEGGNHAQFGNYGKQKGDTDATISREAQQDAAVEAIDQFLSEK